MISLLEKVRREGWRLYDQQGCAIFLHLTSRLRQDKHKAKRKKSNWPWRIGRKTLSGKIPMIPSLFVVLWSVEKLMPGDQHKPVRHATAGCGAVTHYGAWALRGLYLPTWEWADNGDWQYGIDAPYGVKPVNCKYLIAISLIPMIGQIQPIGTRLDILRYKGLGRQNVTKVVSGEKQRKGSKNLLSAFFFPSSPSTCLISILYSLSYWIL